MGNKPDLDDYIDVPARITEFREKYPTGTLQSECQFMEIDGRWTAIVKASAFRTPDDMRPGQGLAYEFIPGRTPYTKDSELQNAETAAWGRAIIAVGAADAKRIASREEVRNRSVAEEVPPNAEGRAALRDLCEKTGITMLAMADRFQELHKKPARDATNEELFAFVALVQGGLVDPVDQSS